MVDSNSDDVFLKCSSEQIICALRMKELIAEILYPSWGRSYNMVNTINFYRFYKHSPFTWTIRFLKQNIQKMKRINNFVTLILLSNFNLSKNNFRAGLLSTEQKSSSIYKSFISIYIISNPIGFSFLFLIKSLEFAYKNKLQKKSLFL